jgi:hypothetical protein
MGIAADAELVSAIKLICENVRAKRRGARKFSISDIRVRFPHVFRRIWDAQAGRCAYCGIVLRYGDDATLDHVVPFHLGDDPVNGSNWRFACPVCNRGKGALPYYSVGTASTNWMPPDRFGEGLSEEVRFAALARDGRCTACGRLPTEGELEPRLLVSTGCWILDNLTVRCVDRTCDASAGTP